MSTAPFTELDIEIGELLDEFEAVVEEMNIPSVNGCGASQRLLSEAKRRITFSDGVTDSGIEDADDAKLGDTSDLESFIENLDKELAGCLRLDLFNVHNVARAISVYLHLVPDSPFKVECGLVNAKLQLIIFKRKIGS
ncbi:hypothetical protein Baya_7329 [Bagarius yarrelli]|uniref:Uncharacterized protein n=1 Tax=Bagarius yarrelli TaxID=175774 RepID=A0A556U1R2_BAGYA|nr:hypothetical protein Baya_7329 [Bagarius yarrelli]